MTDKFPYIECPRCGRIDGTDLTHEEIVNRGEWEKLANTYRTELDALKVVQSELDDLRGVFSHGSQQIATYARLFRHARLVIAF